MEVPGVTGFNAREVRDGLRLAMNIGLPPDLADQPVFVFPAATTTTGVFDADRIPLDWQAARTHALADTTYQVPCAVQDADTGVMVSNFGAVMPDRVLLTFLDEDYVLIEGFTYCELGQNRYYRKKTKPPLGLVSVGVFQVLCQTDDEG